MHVGKRTKQAAECLLEKLPEDFKKKPSFTQINFQSTMKPFLAGNIDQLEKNQERRVILKDLITPLGKYAPDL